MSDLYECGSCGKANLDRKWNEATRTFYGEDVNEIGGDGRCESVFVCPSCGEIIDGELVALVEEVRETPVKIKRLHPDAVIPQYATELAAGFDLVAVEDTTIAPGETKLIPLGFAVEIPEGFEMQIRPRSGVTWKTKLRVGNSPGTIDADFRGEVKVIVDNISREEWGMRPVGENDFEWDPVMSRSLLEVSGSLIDTKLTPFSQAIIVKKNTYIIRKGDRIAQGVIAPVYRADFIVVDQLGETERGDGGFGSTGV